MFKIFHHTFYGNGRTSCDQEIDKVVHAGHEVTGLDSLVNCQRCDLYLSAYRENFPLASNQDDWDGSPILEGGAR